MIKNRLSIWVTIIYLGILFIVAFFGIRELNHINNIKENTIILNKKHQQLSSAKHLIYLDEVLTQSARNYIFTKDTIWHNRYLKATSEFNTALDSVSTIIGLKKYDAIFDKNDKITLALFEAEKLAFEALHENNPDRAIALLSSLSYLENKKIFFERYQELLSDSKHGLIVFQNIHENIIKESSQAISSLIFYYTVSVLIILFSVYYIFRLYNQIRQKNELLKEKNNQYIQVNKKLKESESKYNSYIANNYEGICRFELETPMDMSLDFEKQVKYIYQHLRVSECNDSFAIMYGFESNEELYKKTLGDLWAGEEEGLEVISTYINNGYYLHNIETEEVNKDGIRKWFLNFIDPEIINGKLHSLWTTQIDVSEKTFAQKEIKLLHTAVSQLSNHVMITDQNGRIEYVNSAFTRINGYELKDIAGKLPSFLNSDEHSTEYFIALWKTISKGNVYRNEIVNKTQSGELILQEILITPILNEKGKITNYVAVYTDLEEKEKARLTAKNLEEKEIMITEIHHRVKNNLNSIRSILSLQEARISDEVAKEVLKECQNRIITISRIYDMISYTDDLKALNCKDYLKALVNDLVVTMSVGIEIETKLDIDDILFKSDILMPLGIVVNELITNSFKYAFPDVNKGVIGLSLKSLPNEEYRLILFDNGIGMAKQNEEKASLGKILVQAYVKQLNGSLETNHNSDIGTETVIDFSILNGYN